MTDLDPQFAALVETYTEAWRSAASVEQQGSRDGLEERMGLIWRARRRLERPGHLWVDSIANPDRPPWWRR